MSSLAQTVADETHLLHALHGKIASKVTEAQCSLTKRCIEQLFEALDTECGPDSSVAPRAKVARGSDTAVALLQRRLVYQQQRRSDAEDHAHDL